MNNTNNLSREVREGITSLIGIIGEDREFADREITIEDFLLNMDSIRFIELVTAIENHYSVTFEPDDFLALKSGNLDYITELVLNKVGAKNAE